MKNNPDDMFVNVDDATGQVSCYCANQLPSRIHGLVMEDCGESYTYYNANCSYEMLHKAYRHEQEHIDNGDLDSPTPADQLEAHRHF